MIESASSSEREAWSKIACVIVLYGRKLEVTSTFATLTCSLRELGITKARLIVYDNSPVSQKINVGQLSEWEIHYVHDPENPGVSKAYNYAAGIARSNSREWLLLLDQDTSFPVDAAKIYADCLRPDNSQVLFAPILHSSAGIYSPSRYFFKRGFLWENVRPGKYLLKNKAALNSGLLVKLEAFERAGGYDERIKLYFSDFDFLDRLKAHFDEFVVIDISCGHELSDLAERDPENAKRRFVHYCEGSFLSIKSASDAFWLVSTVGLRAVKLAFRYKDFGFLRIFFSIYILGSNPN